MRRTQRLRILKTLGTVFRQKLRWPAFHPGQFDTALDACSGKSEGPPKRGSSLPVHVAR